MENPEQEEFDIVRLAATLLALLASLDCVDTAVAQQPRLLSTIEYVEIVDGNRAEALHYYQRGWGELRRRALGEGLIHGYQLLETDFTEQAPFHLMLITTYRGEAQYAGREANFQQLIEESGPPQLLNELAPAEFRRMVFYTEPAVQLMP